MTRHLRHHPIATVRDDQASAARIRSQPFWRRSPSRCGFTLLYVLSLALADAAVAAGRVDPDTVAHAGADVPLSVAAGPLLNNSTLSYSTFNSQADLEYPLPTVLAAGPLSWDDRSQLDRLLAPLFSSQAAHWADYFNNSLDPPKGASGLKNARTRSSTTLAGHRSLTLRCPIIEPDPFSDNEHPRSTVPGIPTAAPSNDREERLAVISVLGLNDFHGRIANIDAAHAEIRRPVVGPVSHKALNATQQSCNAVSPCSSLQAFDDNHGECGSRRSYVGAVPMAYQIARERNLSRCGILIDTKGLPYVASARPIPTVTISAGDNIGGSLFESAVLRDAPTVKLFRAIGLNVTAVGNHEFDEGFADVLERLEPHMGTPHLAANLDWSDPQQIGTPFDSHWIWHEPTNDLKVAFIGVVTESLHELVMAQRLVGLTVGSMSAAANRVLEELAASERPPDIYVLIAHAGGYCDKDIDHRRIWSGACGSEFASLVSGLDPRFAAVLTGHTHSFYLWNRRVLASRDGSAALEGGGPAEESESADNGSAVDRCLGKEADRWVPIVQAGCCGEATVRFDFSVRSKNATGDRLVDVTARLVPVETFLPEGILEFQEVPDEQVREARDSDILADPLVREVANIVKRAAQESSRIGSQPHGRILADIVGGHKRREYPLTNLVADALLWHGRHTSAHGADIALVNAGAVRAPLVYRPEKNGTITNRDIVTAMPFNNAVISMTLKGSEILQVLTAQFHNGLLRMYLGVAGIQYVYDPGMQITEAYDYNGSRLDSDKDYRVITNEFVAGGGDGFDGMIAGREISRGTELDREVVVRYFETHSPIWPPLMERAARMSASRNSDVYLKAINSSALVLTAAPGTPPIPGPLSLAARLEPPLVAVPLVSEGHRPWLISLSSSLYDLATDAVQTGGSGFYLLPSHVTFPPLDDSRSATSLNTVVNLRFLTEDLLTEAQRVMPSKFRSTLPAAEIVSNHRSSLPAQLHLRLFSASAFDDNPLSIGGAGWLLPVEIQYAPIGLSRSPVWPASRYPAPRTALAKVPTPARTRRGRLSGESPKTSLRSLRK